MSTDNQRLQRPERALGLGINASDFHISYATAPVVDFLEVTAPSSRLRGSPSYRDVSHAPRGPGFERRGIPDLVETIPLLVHSTNVNPTYPVSCRPEDLAELRSLVQLTGTPWVTEDLGVWLMNERHVYPYFMPLVCTEEVLAVTIDNVRKVQDLLGVPFNAEFPPMTAVVGDLHPFDFFRELTEQTGCFMCIDLGHVLSYQLLRGASAMADSHRLPWSNITEVHIAGGGIDLSSQGFAYEDEHGDEEIVSVCFDMLDDVITYAPRLQAITLELFGARMPGRALARLQSLRERPTVAAWLAGTDAAPTVSGPLDDATSVRALRQHVGLYDLLHTDSPITGEVLAASGSDVLNLFAANERRRWDAVRESRLRLVGGSLADYFPVTLSAIVDATDVTADAIAASILDAADGEEDGYWPAVVTAFAAIVNRASMTEGVAEAFRCERWMNECVRGGTPNAASFHIDVTSATPTSLLARPVEVVFTGTKFQIRRNEHADDRSLGVATDNAGHVCRTPGVKGRGPCCTGR